MNTQARWAGALLLLACGTASAADCAALVKSLGQSGRATLVTLNNRNVASYHATVVMHAGALRSPRGIIPPRMVTVRGDGIDNPGVGPQLFSDRLATGNQPFDINKPDSITLEITESNPVTVTVTLESWGKAKSRFVPTCEAGGFMHGVTTDVHYLLRLSK